MLFEIKMTFFSKKELRGHIKLLKTKYTPRQLQTWSEEICCQIKNLSVWQSAKTVMLYNALPDEVNTKQLLDEQSKIILLPAVEENDLIIRTYEENDNFRKGSYGIQEPTGEIFNELNTIDLIVIPGIAFDQNMNRMGRGKGYYDRFLPQTKAVKIGICFDFQLMENIQAEDFDVKMDLIITPSKQYFR